MSSKSSAFAAGLNALLFHNQDLAGIGDAAGLRGSSAAGKLWVGLHSNDPGVGGSQETEEIDFGDYGRVGVDRDQQGFLLDGNEVTFAEDVIFAQPTSGSGTIRFFSVGTAETGPGMVLYRAELDPHMSIQVGTAPIIDAASGGTEA